MLPPQDIVDGQRAVSLVQSTSNIVKSVLGTYSVVYTASDLQGNITSLYRTVIVDDLESPVISSIGNNPDNIEATLAEYSDDGIHIDDNYYNESDVSITKNLDVITSVPGTYTVSYFCNRSK